MKISEFYVYRKFFSPPAVREHQEWNYNFSSTRIIASIIVIRRPLGRQSFRLAYITFPQNFEIFLPYITLYMVVDPCTGKRPQRNTFCFRSCSSALFFPFSLFLLLFCSCFLALCLFSLVSDLNYGRASRASPSHL